MTVYDEFFRRAQAEARKHAQAAAKTHDGINRRQHVEAELMKSGGVVDMMEVDLSLGLPFEDQAMLRAMARGLALDAAAAISGGLVDRPEDDAKRPVISPPPRTRDRFQAGFIIRLFWMTVGQVRECLSSNPPADPGARLTLVIPEGVVCSLRLIFDDPQMISVLTHTIVTEAQDYVFAESDPKRLVGTPPLVPCFVDMLCRASMAFADVLAREAMPHIGRDAEAYELWLGNGVAFRVAEILHLGFGDQNVAFHTAAAYLLVSSIKAGAPQRYAAETAAAASSAGGGE